MQETTNLKLKKPDLTDYVNVGDLNENADKIDAAVTTQKDALTTHLADDATVLKKGHVQLSNAVTSIDETKAATPKAVKTAMDRADAAFTSASNGKSAVSAAITGVDDAVIIPPEPTFSDLATAIGQISTGKKWASGALSTSSKLVSATSLGFTPSFIYCTVPGAVYTTRIMVYKSDMSVTEYMKSPGSIGLIDNSTNYVKSGSFALTAEYPDFYTWIAFE